MSAASPLPAQDHSGWFEFYLPWDDSTKTVTDLSRYLDAPAGKHGFLEVTPGGFFKFENSEERVRFAGVVNVGTGCYPTKEEARILAARLAKFGINLVRIHLVDVDWDAGLFANSQNNTRELDAGRLDRLDYFLYCLKKRGIYFTWCIQAGRVFKSGDGVDFPVQNSQSKYVTLFNQRLIELQKEFADLTLNHVNPYTGLTYAADPAMANLELTNENSLFLGWLSWQSGYLFAENPEGIGADYAGELDVLFQDWLVQRFGDDQTLRTAWLPGEAATGENLVKNESFENGIQNWRSYVSTGDGASGSFNVVSEDASRGDRSMKIAVNSTGTANWHIQIKTNNFSVERGKDYKLSFAMKADQSTNIQIELLQDYIWTWFGSYDVEVEDEWKQYTYYFTPSRTVVDSFLIQYDFGGTLGTFWLDDVSVVPAVGTGLEEDESLAHGNVKRVPSSEFGKYSAARVGDNAAFYYDVEQAYIQTLFDYLKNELGVRCPVTFTNNYFGLASIYSQSGADYMDTHYYWDHPNFPNGWSDTDWSMHNRPMVKDPLNATLNHMPQCRVKSMPLVLSEYNHPFPSIYQAEMPGLLYAYGGHLSDCRRNTVV